MVELFANSGDPDQTPQKHSAASDLDLHCLPNTLLGVSELQWVKNGDLNYKLLNGSCLVVVETQTV